MGVVIVGGGGHSKVVHDVLVASGERIVGVVDRAPIQNGLEYLGDDSVWSGLLSQGVCRAHVAIGDNAIRMRICEQLLDWGVQLVTAVHPSAYVAPSVTLGHGALVMAGAVLQPDCEIGPFTIVNTCASVDHDGKLGRGVHVGPGATLAGSVSVGDLTFIGAGVTVIPQVSIGSASLVGAGSCVVKSLPDKVVAFGVPAKVIRTIG